MRNNKYNRKQYSKNFRNSTHNKLTTKPAASTTSQATYSKHCTTGFYKIISSRNNLERVYLRITSELINMEHRINSTKGRRRRKGKVREEFDITNNMRWETTRSGGHHRNFNTTHSGNTCASRCVENLNAKGFKRCKAQCRVDTIHTMEL